MIVAATAALTSGLVVPSASADQISNLQAQAAALAAQINTLGAQEDALSERYDQAEGQLNLLERQVAQAQSLLASAQASQNAAKATLQTDALDAYMNGDASPAEQAGPEAANLGAANSGVLRAEYVATLATDSSDAIDRYHLASLQAHSAATNLQTQESAVEAQLNSIEADRSSLVGIENRLSSEESKVKGEVSQLQAEQAQEEAAAQAAQAAAARQAALAQAQQLAAARQQLQQLSPVATATASTVDYQPPPPGSGAAGAVAAAESRVGDWYQWGAAGPNTFDCSGLVMWAYAQVGISLPHYSGAQYADTTHIPMSDLEPGDLVFFANPGEHVAMYVGHGDIIEAPYTGAQVHIIPMYSGFVLASRVEG
jgi:cell wall-associated NlpC family hydrolase